MNGIKTKLSPLVERLWHGEQSLLGLARPLSLPDQARADLHRFIADGLWSTDGLLSSLLSISRSDNVTEGLQELYKFSLKFGHHLHSSSLWAQNTTESIEKFLQLTMNGQLSNSTWWNHLKTEAIGVTEKLHEKRPREFEAKLGDKEAKLETVMAVDGEDAPGAPFGERETPLMFIDSKSNQYVLSHPSGIKSLAAHSEDPSLIRDIVIIWLAALLLGLLVSLLGLPEFFGHVIAGILLGPSGFDVISNVVQVSSLGQIGAYMLLLELGSEFSLTKVKKFAGITILGTLLFTALFSIGWGLFGRFILGSSFGEASFIGLVLSFASTAVSIKCIQQSAKESRAAIVFNVLNIASIITGILLMQDALFSTVISIIPVMSSATQGSTFTVFGNVILFLLKATLCAALTSGALWLIQIHAHPAQRDVMLLIIALGSISLCSLMKISGEYGAFFTGLIYALLNEPSPKDSREELDPESEPHQSSLIKTLSFAFCTLFFASIGLFVDLSFIRAEFLVLLAASSLAIGAKFAIMYSLTIGPFKLTRTQSLLISLNLAQVSELSMALGSKGRRLGIISREVYLLVVGTTMICLVAVPIFWKLAVNSVDKYGPTSPREPINMTEA